MKKKKYRNLNRLLSFLFFCYSSFPFSTHGICILRKHHQTHHPRNQQPSHTTAPNLRSGTLERNGAGHGRGDLLHGRERRPVARRAHCAVASSTSSSGSSSRGRNSSNRRRASSSETGAGGTTGTDGGVAGGDIDLRDGDGGVDHCGGGGGGDGLAGGGAGGVCYRDGERCGEGDCGCGLGRCDGSRGDGAGEVARGGGHGWGGRGGRDQSYCFRDVGDDTWVGADVRGADAREVGQRGLDLAVVVGPRCDAVLDVLGEFGVLAEAV